MYYYRQKSVTKTELADYLDVSPKLIGQFGRKQLFMVDNDKIYSYFTLIAVRTAGSRWQLRPNAREHSRTTNLHIKYLEGKFSFD